MSKRSRGATAIVPPLASSSILSIDRGPRVVRIISETACSISSTLEKVSSALAPAHRVIDDSPCLCRHDVSRLGLLAGIPLCVAGKHADRCLHHLATAFPTPLLVRLILAHIFLLGVDTTLRKGRSKGSLTTVLQSCSLFKNFLSLPISSQLVLRSACSEQK